MNIIVDIDPYLKKAYKIKQFSSADDLEAEEFSIEINTRAINYTRIFSMFDISSEIFTYLGGFVGDNYRELLRRENTLGQIINIKDSTREKLFIYDGIRDLKIYSKTPRITNDERNNIYEGYLEAIKESDFIILPETNNSVYEEEFYVNFINVAFKAGKKLALSTNKSNINKLISYRPHTIVVDKKALESFANKELNFNWEINNVIKEIIDLGIKYVIYYSDKATVQVQDKDNIVTSFGEGFDFHKESKDKVLAGFIASINKNYDLEMAAKIALAASNLELKREELNRNAGIIKASINNIEIEQVNVRK